MTIAAKSDIIMAITVAAMPAPFPRIQLGAILWMVIIKIFDRT